MKEAILQTLRRQIRYFLYRLRTEAEGSGDAPPEARAFGSYYEGLDGFDGWLNFARTWDLGPDGRHDQIVPRLYTEEQEWNLRLAQIARPFPR